MQNGFSLGASFYEIRARAKALYNSLTAQDPDDETNHSEDNEHIVNNTERWIGNLMEQQSFTDAFNFFSSYCSVYNYNEIHVFTDGSLKFFTTDSIHLMGYGWTIMDHTLSFSLHTFNCNTTSWFLSVRAETMTVLSLL